MSSSVNVKMHNIGRKAQVLNEGIAKYFFSLMCVTLVVLNYSYRMLHKLHGVFQLQAFLVKDNGL